MSQFIESICCIDGELQLLDLHQARINRTFFTNYGLLARPIRLSRIIKNIPPKGKYKCRVIYDRDQATCTFDAYQIPNIKNLQIVEGGDIDYRYKYVDRNTLDNLFAQRNGKDDILIVKNGLVTDSYFANLAFFDGEEWFTPDTPLLEGVQRQSLLDQRQIKVTKISIEDLEKFEKVSLINAMLELAEVELPAISIHS